MNFFYNVGKALWSQPTANIPGEAPGAAPDPVQEVGLAALAAQQHSNCTVLPTLNCADSIEWRNQLVKSAKHNIIVSGNYCGGKAFDEFLDLIAGRMEEVPTLKVVIIGHPKFVKDMPRAKSNPHENLTKISNLKSLYPNRFCFVESPDIKFNGKTVTNHTKCTVIDYGKYYMQGGSAIKDNFALTGKDDETTQAFLKKYWNSNGEQPDPIEDEENIADDFALIPYADEEAIGNDGFMDKIIPGNFRDEDFVFKCSDDDPKSGIKMYQEALYLAFKWDQHAKGTLPSESWELDDLYASKDAKVLALLKEYPALAKNEWADLFRTFPELRKDYTSEKIEAKASQMTPHVLYSMMGTPIPDLKNIDSAVVESFDRSERKVSDVATRLFFTGPEQDVSPYLKAMIEAVDHAEREIIIDQMYFQPPHELRIALQRAVNERGVKIILITAGLTENCPNGQLFFGHRNRWKYFKLMQSLPKDKQNLVTVYEYAQRKKGLHKKVVIVDDQVFAGSSNMGTKSLKLMGDHEMNFQAKSQELVDRMKQEIIDDDIQHSLKIENPTDMITYKNQAMAAIHRVGASLWG